jgi:hypothetical protein
MFRRKKKETEALKAVGDNNEFAIEEEENVSPIEDEEEESDYDEEYDDKGEEEPEESDDEYEGEREEEDEGETRKANNIVKFPDEHIKITQYEFKRNGNNAEYERICFVAQALGTKSVYDHRSYLDVIHIEPSETNGCKLVATDGIRLHSAELDYVLPEGNYHVLYNNKSVKLNGPLTYEIDYPNYRRVLFENLKEICTVNLYDTGLGKNYSKNLNMTKEFAKIKTFKSMAYPYRGHYHNRHSLRMTLICGIINYDRLG